MSAFGSAQLDPDITGTAPPEQGEFSKGLSSGLRGAGSQLRSLGAGVAGAAGFDQFAQEQNALAQQEAQQAQATAPRVSSYKDVGSLRDAGDYVAGLAGQALPMVGLGVGAGAATALTGGGALPAIAAGALTQLPFETGDVLQRQQQDPTARARGYGENLRDALLAGGASAVGQSVVPAAFGGKLVGAGLKGGLRSLTGAVGREAGINALGGAGGELAKQQGVQLGAAPDLNAAAEAGVGGAVLGAGFGAGGHVAESFHGNKAALADGAGSLLDMAKGGTDKLKAAAAPATDAVTDFAGKLKEAATRGPSDEDLAASGGLTPQEMAQAGDPATDRGTALSLLKKGDESAAGAVQRFATAFADRADIDPETRAKFADAAANATDTVKQAWATTTAGAIKAKDTVMKTVQDVQGALGDVKDQSTGDKKLSADMSGQREAIVQEVMPHLPEGVINDPASLRQVGDTVSRVVEAIRKGDIDNMQPAMQGMHRIFGDETEGLLTRIYDKVADASPEETARFMDRMAQSKTLRAQDTGLRDTIQKALPEGSTADVQGLMDGLIKWGSGSGKVANNAALTPAMHDQIRQRVQETFGKNTDKVMGALEKHITERNVQAEQKDSKSVKESDDVGTAAGNDFGSMSEKGTANDFYGAGKNRQKLDPFLLPEAHKARFGDKYESAGEKLIKQLEAKHPDREISMMPAREAAKELGWSEERLSRATNGNPDEHGFVVSKRIEDPDVLGDSQIKKMRLDTDKYPNSDAKVKIGKDSFDAVAMTRHFLENGQGKDSTSNSLVRAGRAFMEGVSALAERFSKDDMTAKDSQGRAQSLGFDESTRIGSLDGKPLTLGEALKADNRTVADVKTDMEKARIRDALTAARDAFKAEKNPEKRAALGEKVKELVQEGKDFHDRGVLAGDERAVDTTKDDILGGRQEVDQSTGNIHELEATGGVKEVNHNSDGSARETPRASSSTAKGAEAVANVKALAARIGKVSSEAAQKVSARLDVLAKNMDMMSAADRRDLTQLVNATKVSDVAETVNALARKYADRIAPPKGADKVVKNESKGADKVVKDEPGVGSDGRVTGDSQEAGATIRQFEKERDAQAGPAGETPDERALREQFGEGPQSPKAEAAKKAALDQAASSSDPALLKELRTTQDGPALQRTAQYLDEKHPDSDAARVAGQAFDRAVNDPDMSYSMQKAHPGTSTTINARAEANAVLAKSLGNSVAVEWAKLPHAGEFERTSTGDVIRLSVNALNPKSVAYHESLHAFFGQLRDAGASRISQVLEKAASQNSVKRYLDSYFKNEPEVLKQLKGDAEERAAYMYQLWSSDPAFRSVLNPQATTIFGKIAEFIRGVTGIWSNDQRAIHIMEHFQSGEYAKNIGKPNVAALLGEGRNAAVDTLANMAQPLAKLGSSLMGAGSERLRDTGNAHLNSIADLIKPRIAGGENNDTGFLAAARTEFTSRLNRFGEALAGVDKKDINAALVHLQEGTTPTDSTQARVTQHVKDTLAETMKYVKGTGVDFGDLGKDYFPRVWDADTIAQNQTGFLKMLEFYKQQGVLKSDPREVLRKLIANDGNNFDVDTRTPGFQNAKERSLAFISGSDAQPFLNKDMYQTMSSYVSQATRRAEWARRFGAQGEGLDKLFANAAKDGASKEQLQLTEKYLKGVTGTLGDGLNPEARRLMGNAIVYQNLRLLPLAIFSSTVDPLGITLRGGSVRDAFSAFGRGMSEIKRNFQKYDPARRDGSELLAEHLGVIENASLAHTLGALYSQGMTSDTGRKINDTFFRFNLMEQFNRSMRVSATESAVKFIEQHAQNVDPKNSERWLAELNLKPSDVQMGPAVPANGKLVPRMKITEQDGLSAEHAAKIRDAINKWVDGAVLRPDSADKPVWMNDPHFALISHLKQFTYAFQHTIISRVVNEAKEGNYKPAAVLASYVPTMIAADFAKGFIQGGGSQPAWKRDWGPEDYLWSGVQRGGLLGVGQFGADAAAGIARGHSGLGSLAGPTLEQMGDAADVMGGRGRFNDFFLQSMPANALYSSAFKGVTPKADPTFSE